MTPLGVPCARCRAEPGQACRGLPGPMLHASREGLFLLLTGPVSH